MLHSPTSVVGGAEAWNGTSIDGGLVWDDIAWLQSLSALPVVVKGVLTAEDAAQAVKAGCAGVWVSNHGGRQLDGVPAALDALPEVVAAVGGAVEVYVDGGVRRGMDVFKVWRGVVWFKRCRHPLMCKLSLVAQGVALGATAVFIGRPVIWGLACKVGAALRW